MKNLGPAIIAVLLAIVITSMLAMVGLPLLDSLLVGASQNTRSVLAVVIILVLLGMVAGFSLPVYDWLVRRAEAQARQKEGEQDPNFEKKPMLAFGFLGLICIAIFAYELLISTDRNSNVSLQVGENLVYGFILFAVFTHFLGKHLSKQQKSLSLVVIVTALTGGSVLFAQMRVQSDNESYSRIQDNVLSVLEGPAAEDGRMQPLQVPPDSGSAKSENAIVEAAVTGYLNKLIANNNNYVTELEAIGYDSLIDGARIQADTDMDESQFILDRTAAIIDKYEELNEQTAFEFRDSFDEQNVSAATRATFRESYDEGMESSLERARQIWNLERQALELVGELVGFLNMTRTNWYMEEEQFVFATDKNLAIFNSLLTRIDETVAQQEAIRAKSAEITRGILDEANN